MASLPPCTTASAHTHGRESRLKKLLAVLLILLPTPVFADAQQDAMLDAGAANARGDYAAELKITKPLAEKGEAWAQLWLGLSYGDGNGVLQDDAEAVKWYRLAAAQGDAKAQYELGAMYYNGLGAVQDYAEAVKWYRLAAAQGDALAQCDLGVAYATGQGVMKDNAEAVKWFRLAAAQGNERAQGNLGVSYENGTGVVQDYRRAHMWFNLGAVSGKYEKAAKNRDKIAAKMTPAQIAEAQKLARECQARNFKGC